MASYFQSFRQSLMPKQLLRFVLQRVDLLDEAALDLENLGFDLGRNTVLEFRDVGLVLQKLEKLLELPPSFSIQKAKVLVLRITVPMDFYTSPIIAEVDGVDVRVKVASKEEMDQQQQHNKKRRKGRDDVDVVPNAADLAQSFLETQPVADKRELEEALAAESQDLGASISVSSESGSDDGLAYGTGQPLSLPAFLTDFLQGIVDRLQVRVQGVSFQVDMEVPVDANTQTPELVTFQFSVDKVNVEGVTAQADGSEVGPAIIHKEGKRHILLDTIRASLISEANLFSSLVPSPSMVSSAASRSPITSETPGFPQPFGSGASTGPGSVASDDLAQSHYQLQDSEAALNIPYDFEQNDQYDENEDQNSPNSTPRASVYQDVPPSIFKGQAKSTIIGPGVSTWTPPEREAQSEPFLRAPDNFPFTQPVSPSASVHSESSRSSSPGGPEIEDLTESHLYSHEEAESMYMSAFSNTGSSRLQTGMPGSWDEEAEDSRSLKDESDPPHSLTTSHQYSPPLEPISGEEPPESLLQRSSPQRQLSPEPLGSRGDVTSDEQAHFQDPEPQQDDVPTPRGPTRLVKDILSLSSISVYLPSTHKHIQVTAPDLGKSHPDLPGTFSVYSTRSESPTQPRTSVQQDHAPHDPSIEVILKPLEVRFDASIAFLLAMVIGRLMEALQSQSNDIVNPATPKSESKTPDIKLIVEKLSIQFLEKLAGVADIPQRHFDHATSEFHPDILLQANLVDLRASVLTTGSKMETNLSIEKVTFGYANDEMISFDRSVQMYESTINKFPSAGQDVSIKVLTRSGESRVDISTLPMHIKLDLQRLDETFTWFGGLSSFLNMGSSISSNASRSAKTAAKATKKSKGVHFEASIDSSDGNLASQSKTDLRINGLRVDVVGKDCSVVLNTSALKLINRGELLGVHFSKIRLAGPYLRNSKAEAPVLIHLHDTRLEFMQTPRGADLERLLELITPSKIKFDEDEDEIMVDTLLAQRRKGSVLSLSVSKLIVHTGRLQQLSCLPSLAEDLAKLGTVAKYLPEDDRPGLLTLTHVKNVELGVDVGGRFGVIQAALTDLEVAHITVPSLVAVALGEIAVTRNQIEELVGTPPAPAGNSPQKPPVLMMRMIDDIEPVVKVILNGFSVEYRVPTIMDVLDLAEDATPRDFETSLAASVANLGDHAHAAIKGAPMISPTPDQTKNSKPIKVDVGFRDCLIGLNPLGLTSKLTIVLADAHLDVTPGKQDTVHAVSTLKKASVLLIDDVSLLDAPGAPFASSRRSQVAPSKRVTDLCAKGYVSICQISAAKATVKTFKDETGNTQAEVEVKDDLLIIETCADSTQTLITLANALKPPTPPSKEIKYRTTVVPIEDMLASITNDAFGQAEGDYDFDRDFEVGQSLGGDTDSELDYYGGQNESPLNLDSQFYDDEDTIQEELFDATAQSLELSGTKAEDTADGVLLSTAEVDMVSSTSALSIHEDFFEHRAAVKGTAHRWDSRKNRYDESSDVKVQRSPLKVCVRDVHVIWHLFDGYDWARTREVITKAVQEVETKAYERRAQADRRTGYDQDRDDEEIVGDYLFNSIYIGIPANRDPRELAQAINNDLQDMNDTESIATTAVTTTTIRAAGHHRSRSKNLKLNRSKRHKITFELKGVNADLVTFPPGVGETDNSIDVRIHDLDVFDHVPTSTWRKFAMYDQDAGEREMGSNMVHLEILNTRPMPSMPASEIVLKVSILPLRLHVDQDALDFITRFFEFKDDSVPVHASPSDIPFIQRAEIKDIPVTLDFKPKRVDYAGLRSGHTTEFMNFIILQESRLVLRHAILYGVSGFDKLGMELNDLWTADVKKSQLPGILAGLAPVRSLVNAASGFRDLIEIPITEYRKDGRIVRSIKKGATAFAKTTGTEVVKLGAKLALGAQSALQGAEGMLVKPPGGGGESSSSAAFAAAAGADDWDEGDYDTEEAKRQVSLYANQPLGIVQGMRGAYASLARDLAMTKDAIIAVPAEVMESTNAQGAAQAVLKRAPTIIFRPAIGATKAIGQTLLGATNSLDPANRRRAEAVSFMLLFFLFLRGCFALLLMILIIPMTEIQEGLIVTCYGNGKLFSLEFLEKKSIKEKKRGFIAWKKCIIGSRRRWWMESIYLWLGFFLVSWIFFLFWFEREGERGYFTTMMNDRTASGMD
ncbi:hypothetical protein QBC38DRAFT_371073 [Podospora fimiseda]|uniref:Autophagy-related protein 2 n=1 Tax=Podospora fimiseda TaxID=252190 RepID=A0AAN7BJF5_9PEZI|nr:hypothetical protein QBC38DRAFT_371073 [Podospora fimiseda]